jgi:hypothetical protein
VIAGEDQQQGLVAGEVVQRGGLIVGTAQFELRRAVAAFQGVFLRVECHHSTRS